MRNLENNAGNMLTDVGVKTSNYCAIFYCLRTTNERRQCHRNKIWAFSSATLKLLRSSSTEHLLYLLLNCLKSKSITTSVQILIYIRDWIRTSIRNGWVCVVLCSELSRLYLLLWALLFMALVVLFQCSCHWIQRDTMENEDTKETCLSNNYHLQVQNFLLCPFRWLRQLILNYVWNNGSWKRSEFLEPV